MAEENIKVLSGIKADAIVVTCGSCGLALKEHYAELFDEDSDFGRQAKEIGAKIKDISQLLAELPFAEGMSEILGTVTYHDPCHLKNGLGVSAEPREILKSIPGLQYIENENGHCCGSGGSFSLKHYDLSAKITGRCLDALKRHRRSCRSYGLPGLPDAAGGFDFTKRPVLESLSSGGAGGSVIRRAAEIGCRSKKFKPGASCTSTEK